MFFGIGHVKGKARITIHDEDFSRVAVMSLSEDDHGWRLIIRFTDEGKESRVIRL